MLAKAIVYEIELDGELLVYARTGDIGHVIELNQDHLPTILWERSGMVCDAAPDIDFDWLCGPEFGREPPAVPSVRRPGS